MEALSDNYTVIAWDAPGCGQSSDPPEDWRLPDYADCLAGFLGAIGLDRVHLLGHSWGSGLALELYRRHRTVPASLILVGAYAGWAGSLPPEEVATRLALALEIADRLPEAFDPESVPGLFSDAMDTEARAELAAVMADVRAIGTRVMALSFAEADLRDMLGSVSLPTLLVCGELDRRAPPDVARALHAAIPRSRLVLLPGLGHELYLESTPLFAQEVRRFLADSLS